MQADEFFSMRLTRQDKAMLRNLAKHFQRSKSDTVKVIIRREYASLTNEKLDETKGRKSKNEEVSI